MLSLLYVYDRFVAIVVTRAVAALVPVRKKRTGREQDVAKRLFSSRPYLGCLSARSLLLRLQPFCNRCSYSWCLSAHSLAFEMTPSATVAIIAGAARCEIGRSCVVYSISKTHSQQVDGCRHSKSLQPPFPVKPLCVRCVSLSPSALDACPALLSPRDCRQVV